MGAATTSSNTTKQWPYHRFMGLVLFVVLGSAILLESDFSQVVTTVVGENSLSKTKSSSSTTPNDDDDDDCLLYTSPSPRD